jgi:hypothetical protein
MQLYSWLYCTAQTCFKQGAVDKETVETTKGMLKALFINADNVQGLLPPPSTTAATKNSIMFGHCISWKLHGNHEGQPKPEEHDAHTYNM